MLLAAWIACNHAKVLRAVYVYTNVMTGQLRIGVRVPLPHHRKLGDSIVRKSVSAVIETPRWLTLWLTLQAWLTLWLT